MRPKIVVIIPAFNEEQSIGKVVEHIPKDWVDEVIVVDNNSTDQTSQVAETAGATVLSQPIQGYGNACLKGIDYAKSLNPLPEIIVFMDGDFSDYPEELPLVVGPIIDKEMDMVIGSRALGDRQKGSMTPQQVFGNWLATSLLRLFYGVSYSDLGPFRAIRFNKLVEIGMKDRTYGWTVEMQLKAAKHKLNTCEVPVNYKVRIGFSKVSGTLKGTIMAGYKILWTIFKYL